MKVKGTIEKWNHSHVYLSTEEGSFWVDYEERYNLQKQFDYVPPMSTFVGLEVEATVEMYERPSQGYTHLFKAIFVGHVVLNSIKIIKGSENADSQ